MSERTNKNIVVRTLDKFEIVSEHKSISVVMSLRYHETLLEREHIKYNFRGKFCEKAKVQWEFER